jgi:transposase
MSCYVGLDASKNTTNICVMDPKGSIIREGVVDSDPRAIVGFLRGHGLRYAAVGMEAWTLSNWLSEGLARARLRVICIETRHAHSVLKARAMKTDRSDARGIADLIRTGTYQPVYAKSEENQQVRALLTARQLLASRALSMENSIRSLLLSLGLRIAARHRGKFAARVMALVSKNEFAIGLIAPLLNIRAILIGEADKLEKRLVQLTKADPVCKLLMSVPGVGPLTSITFKSAIDDPHRFTASRGVGAYLGLVPKVRQSGRRERRGRITKTGDRMVRSGLYLAAMVILRRGAPESWLGKWGAVVAARRGVKRARVAVTRRLAVVLHRMWITKTPFRPALA